MPLVSVRSEFTKKIADFENLKVAIEISDVSTELPLDAQLADSDTTANALLDLLGTKMNKLYNKGKVNNETEESE